MVGIPDLRIVGSDLCQDFHVHKCGRPRTTSARYRTLNASRKSMNHSKFTPSSVSSSQAFSHSIDFLFFPVSNIMCATLSYRCEHHGIWLRVVRRCPQSQLSTLVFQCSSLQEVEPTRTELCPACRRDGKYVAYWSLLVPNLNLCAVSYVFLRPATVFQSTLRRGVNSASFYQPISRADFLTSDNYRPILSIYCQDFANPLRLLHPLPSIQTSPWIFKHVVTISSGSSILLQKGISRDLDGSYAVPKSYIIFSL
jgi:hypothetical protein